jgi:CheY-like chemotaxis protein
MDLVMPVVDGFEAIRAIRDTPELEGTTVIAVSASVAETIRQECLRVGFDGFLPKPFRQFELLEMIRKLTGVVWVHEQGTPREQPEPEREAVPPPELLDALEVHVASGNIRKILEAADELRRAGDEYRSVADRIGGMAQEFQINKLADYINRLRHATVSDDE